MLYHQLNNAIPITEAPRKHETLTEHWLCSVLSWGVLNQENFSDPVSPEELALKQTFPRTWAQPALCSNPCSLITAVVCSC